jgi:hypothetical protein
LAVETLPPGTEFLLQSGGQKTAWKTAGVSGDQNSGTIPAKMPAETAYFQSKTISAVRGLDGGVRSHMRTGLHWKFPDHKQKSEILAFSGRFGRCNPLHRSAFSWDSLIQLTGKIWARTGIRKRHAVIRASFLSAALNRDFRRLYRGKASKRDLISRRELEFRQHFCGTR